MRKLYKTVGIFNGVSSVGEVGHVPSATFKEGRKTQKFDI